MFSRLDGDYRRLNMVKAVNPRAPYRPGKRLPWPAFWSSMLGLSLLAGCTRMPETEPFPAEQIEITRVVDGQSYFLVANGNAYREIEPNRRWQLVERVFDPEEIKRSYVTESGTTYRVDPENQRRFAVLRQLNDGFDDLSTGPAGLTKLVSEERLLWGSFTLQSPQAPTVADYVALRRDLLAGTSDFRDGRIEPTQEKARSGSTSLKCVAVAKPESMITCKASLSSPLVYFRNGDDFWFEAAYWIEGQRPLTLVDLECEFVVEQPGIRLRIFEDHSLGVELKALDKPQYRQAAETRVSFPIGRWVVARVHYLLAPDAGRIEVWQDGQQVLDCSGITLPFRSAIYNSLEIGISAHSDPAGPSVVYVDDVRCADSEFPAQ